MLWNLTPFETSVSSKEYSPLIVGRLLLIVLYGLFFFSSTILPFFGTCYSLSKCELSIVFLSPYVLFLRCIIIIFAIVNSCNTYKDPYNNFNSSIFIKNSLIISVYLQIFLYFRYANSLHPFQSILMQRASRNVRRLITYFSTAK